MPPPNQFFCVQINLVLKCIAGIFGFLGCKITDTPEDQKLILFFVPGIFFANSLVNFPFALEKATLPFSITSPLIVLNSPCFHLFFLNFISDPYLSSSCSMVLQIIFCNLRNHSLVNFFFLYSHLFTNLSFALELLIKL